MLCLHNTDTLTIYVLLFTSQGLRAHPIQSANNDKKQRKRERDRARYAAMSQEEKNARNLRLREARQKKKGAGFIIYLFSYIYYPVIWMGHNFMGCYQLVASFKVPTCSWHEVMNLYLYLQYYIL